MALISCKNLLQDDSVEYVKLLMKQAVHCFLGGMFKEAIGLLDQAQQLTIGNNENSRLLLEIYNLKGILYGKVGDIARAESLFESARNTCKYHST